MIDKFLGLLTNAEWLGLIIILAFSFTATHFTKIIVRYIPKIKRGMKREEIWIFTLVAALVSSYSVWPSESQISWWIIGAIGSPILNMIYKYGAALMKWKAPGLYNIINADRSVFSERRSDSVTVKKDRRKPK